MSEKDLSPKGQQWVPHNALMPQPMVSLRDWFAGQAPAVPNWWMEDGCPTPPPGWKEGDGAIAWNDACNRWAMMRHTSWRYAYADAMIAERVK